jgi:hypothetical protein
MNTITLEIEITGEVTAVFDGEHAKHIRELFGSNRVPTPYTFKGMEHSAEWPITVLYYIRAANPGVLVRWSTEYSQQFAAFQFTQQCRKETQS